jgi:hypothetical protein
MKRMGRKEHEEAQRAQRVVAPICLFLMALLMIKASAQTAVPLWGNLKPGPYKPGFHVIPVKDKNDSPFFIGLWYPASHGGNKMMLRNYVETGLMNGKQDKATLSEDFKRTLELPFLFGIDKISAERYNQLLSAPVAATTNAEMERGKWPLIISDTEPVSLFVTNEWLASQGFIVAIPIAEFPPPSNDSVLYKGPTDALELLLQYVMKQSFVDTSNISALGFGGGTMAAFYLSMKTRAIKCLVNIEGGIFMPLSKTTLSRDYAPQKFTIPLMHVMQPQITRGESETEFNAVKAPKYRVTILPAAIQHHDFTVYGRVVNAVLQKRGSDAALATEVFARLHEMVLDFLKYRRLSQSSVTSPELFRVEVF